MGLSGLQLADAVGVKGASPLRRKERKEKTPKRSQTKQGVTSESVVLLRALRAFAVNRTFFVSLTLNVTVHFGMEHFVVHRSRGTRGRRRSMADAVRPNEAFRISFPVDASSFR
jgi:hypothetical protein